MHDDVLDMIGTAALLEQLAEESAELAQAALKMAPRNAFRYRKQPVHPHQMDDAGRITPAAPPGH